MNWLSIIPLYLKYGSVVQWIWNAATSNQDFITKVEQLLPAVANVANQIATEFFPDAAPLVAKITTTALTFNTALVEYAQRACNALLKDDPPLEVDGMYGPLTKEAVTKLQTQLGLTADGIFGKITEAAVKKLNLPALA